MDLMYYIVIDLPPKVNKSRREDGLAMHFRMTISVLLLYIYSTGYL